LLKEYLKEISLSRNTLVISLKSFFNIGGSQRAASFAYYALFSIFPLLALAVAIASLFVDQDRAAGAVTGFIKNYAPLREKMNHHIFKTLVGMAEVRGQVMVIAPLLFGAAAFRFLNVLIRAVNRAWGTWEKKWWVVPKKNLILLGILILTILLGVGLPITGRMAKYWLLSSDDFILWIYDAVVYFGPLLILFVGLTIFYKLTPCRPTRFAEVWLASLAVTGLLFTLESLFVVYLKNFSRFNVVYGAFGGIMAILTLIYFSGCTLIWGACLSAAQMGVTAHGRRNLR
jgi:YihY family inner membrane protein